jgi:hypothetical protein
MSQNAERPTGRTPLRDLRTHPDPYVSTSDLAASWGIHRRALYKHTDAGTLGALRIGRVLRISTAEAIWFEAIASMSPARAIEPGPQPDRRGDEATDANDILLRRDDDLKRSVAVPALRNWRDRWCAVAHSLGRTRNGRSANVLGADGAAVTSGAPTRTGKRPRLRGDN